MKRYFKAIVILFLLISILVGGFAVHSIGEARAYGTLINYLGLVRGGTQRLIMLELNDNPNDELMDYLDEILLDLNTSTGVHKLVMLDDADYQQNLGALNGMWHQVKAEIISVRKGGDSTNLLELSGSYFDLSNTTVFSADQYTTQKTKELGLITASIVLCMVATWIGIFIYAFRHLRRLEDDNQNLSDLAFTDTLTGAPNIERFKLDAQDYILRYRNQKFAILYIDINNFKYLNDVFGYAYGDRLLCEYANIISADLDNFDNFCRISADNFLIMRSYHEKSDLVTQQKAIDHALSQFAMQTKDINFFRTCVGICCLDDVMKNMTITDLIERANFARKMAKGQALQSYAFYDEKIRQRMLAEKTIENHMQAALDKEEFHVYLQPKVDLHTGKIGCAEALVRWITADGTMISPVEFIPIFEQNLFIIDLDQYMLRAVCKWLRRRLDDNLPIVPISVNVSRMQLYDPEFIHTYISIKNKFEIPDFILQIEFTESVVFENLELLLEIIATLQKNGFTCALDDFGKGYSSLNLLKSLPVDELKLDGLFFEEDHNQERAHTVISGIVRMAKELNLRIVAEGVESLSQVEFLKRIGCDFIQGYVYYRPMPVVELEKLLNDL